MTPRLYTSWARLRELLPLDTPPHTSWPRLCDRLPLDTAPHILWPTLCEPLPLDTPKQQLLLNHLYLYATSIMNLLQLTNCGAWRVYLANGVWRPEGNVITGIVYIANKRRQFNFLPSLILQNHYASQNTDRHATISRVAVKRVITLQPLQLQCTNLI